MKKSIRAVVSLLFVGYSAAAATLNVDQTGGVPGSYRTIGEAAAKAQPGDTVLVHRGVYREHVAPERGGTAEAPLTFRAAHPGEVFVKGSDVWKPELTQEGENVYSAPVPADGAEFPNPFKRRLNAAGSDKNLPARPADGELLPYSLGQIFSDGVELRQSQTVSEVRRVPGSWIISADGSRLLLHFPAGTDPKQSLLEITLRDRVFAPARRGLGYIHLEGFVFEHCANQAPFPQLGMVSTRSGHHWTIKNNLIRHAKTVGLDVGSEYWQGGKIPKTTVEDQKLMRKGGHHLVTENRVTGNGLSGIAGWSCTGTVISGNIVEGNNHLSLSTYECNWEEWGGIKLHEAAGARIEGNLVRFNGAHGIWIDNGYDQARITRNVVFGNLASGVFIELGAGSVLIDNNIIANTTPYSSTYPGHGVYAHDASGVRVIHNLILANAGDGVYMHRVTDRKYHGKPVETSDEVILNNIFYRNGGGVSLPYPGADSRNCVSDRNLFIGKVDFRYNGKTPWETIRAAAAERLTAGELAAAEVTRRFLPAVWPKVSGREAASLFREERDLEIRVKPFEPSFYVYNRANLKPLFEAVPGIDRDYEGSPYGEKVFPGPFQRLEPGTNYRLLFPVMSPGTLVPENRF